MKLVVSGAREGFSQRQIDDALDGYLALNKQLIVIEGCADGVDSQVHEWATGHGAAERFGRHWDWDKPETDRLVLAHFPAHWAEHGGCWCDPSKTTCKFAGHRRNLEMLTLEPDEVVTFHPFIKRSKGTRHMAIAANDRDIKVRLVGSTMALGG